MICKECGDEIILDIGYTTVGRCWNGECSKYNEPVTIDEEEEEEEE